MKLTRQNILQIAGAAAVDPRTVERAYGGKSVRTMIRERITAAAKNLKMIAPPSKT
jgi:DNA-binding LacI/PurR family transcriptional regulator